MKRFLLIVVVAVAVGFAFVQYKVTSSVSDGLESIKRTIAPFVRMEYGDVSTTWSGNIEVTDLRFVSLRNNEEIVADKIGLNTGNLWVLMNLQDKLRENKIPDRLEFSIEGLVADMEFMTNLQNTAVTDSLYTKLETAGCNGRSRFSRRDISAMGFDRLVLDMTMGYQLSEGGTRIRFTNRMLFRDLMAVSLDMVLDRSNSINEAGLSAETASSMSLSSASIGIEDHGQLGHMLELCAGETGMTTAEYQKHHMDAWVAQWQKMGLKPSESFVEVYRDYIGNPGSKLVFEMEPFPALDLGDNYLSPDPVYLSGRLNPKMGTERTGMQPVSIALAEQDIAASDAEQPESPTTDKKSTAPADSVSSRNPESPADLKQYLQRDVSITLKSGQRMEGVILRIDGDAVKLRRHIHGGSMVVPVQVRDIQTVSRL
ncbi:hypothetical protein ACQUWM_14315 [Marinobacter sp. DUT-3]|uniref:hypothetical protein n=1 Tax=Marinobacter sp. DUT-3 TaxID=3412036 RepID=UPI003D184506